MTGKELGQQEAYPRAAGETHGMTKREAAAVAAMQGMLAYGNGDSNYPDEKIARFSVERADDLMDALAKGMP